MVNQNHWKQGSMSIELVLALTIVTTILLPLGFSFVEEQHACRVYYWRAVAMEAVDGEMEVLAAGEWRAFPQGVQPYVVHSESAKYLPPGKFVLRVHERNLHLEWRPDKMRNGAPVIREAVGR
jgi:hypothetical protein